MKSKNEAPLRILLVGAQCDKHDVGEAWCGYEWISRIASEFDVTLLTLRHPGRIPPSVQLPGVKVVEWDSFPYFSSWSRFNSSIKPWYPHFYFKARRWIKESIQRGESYDLLHHITPMALRYPTPCAGLGLRYVIGPVAGALSTPAAFNRELVTEPFFAKLRNTDSFRLRYDPMIRHTFQDAALVICSTPYVQDALAHLSLNRVECETEVGFDELAPPIEAKNPNRLRLLYVGRVVRTKGLRDAIRAMARTSDLPNITLDVVGDGEDLIACREEADSSHVSHRIRFWGRLPRERVEEFYKKADVFLFPSFREPTGIVLFEAMRHGLPVIAASVGGPGYIINSNCGVHVDPREPQQFADDIARAIRSLYEDRGRLSSLGHGARCRAEELGLWSAKIQRMVNHYKEIALSI